MDKMGPHIANSAKEIKSSIKKDQDTIGPEVSQSNKNLEITIEIISLIVIILILVLGIFIPRDINTQVSKFQEGLLDFFRYLNRDIDDVKLLQNSSNNEIGIMSKVVNDNIIKTKKGIEEDRLIINETIQVLNEFEQGDLCQRITSKVNNPALNELKNVLNNMGNNLEDHVLAIKHLGQKYSWINTDKVGVFGHSAGGYDTGRAMLAFSDVYKVGVASSGDHDFRMEKAWWPEMYQGWPVDETYKEVSNITNAENLIGKLLLVHGGIDDNVNPSATFKLAEALVNADKEFDLLIFPSQRHGYVGEARNYFIKKRWNYFVEHLLNAKPIWDFNWE